MKKSLLGLISFFYSFFVISQGQDFVQVTNGKFTLNNQTYSYLGTNFWYGMNLGAYDQERLIKELDHLKSIGLTNLRVMAGSEGPNTEPYRITPALQVEAGVYNDSLWTGLDFLLNEMKKRNMKAVMCLSNFWPWSGGFGQYLVWAGEASSIPYPPPEPRGTWNEYQRFASKFYKSSKAMKLFENHISKVITRTNTITNAHYKDDPTIMSWELSNEPKGMQNIKAFNKWIKKSSQLIKSLDHNHLITIGTEGSTPNPKYAGLNFKKNHSYKNIDYSTIHIWIENFGWYDPKKHDKTYPNSEKKALDYLTQHVKWAQKMNKPLVLEEFGIARDDRSYNPDSAVTKRDIYYEVLFKKCISLKNEGKPIQGINFWAWAGESRPLSPYGSLWKHNDPIIGDPPHEHQGWYSVYATDTSTIQLLKKYSNVFSRNK